MKQGQSLWTREELILTLNLYCKLTFGQLNSKNAQVIKLSQLIGRTSGSVAFKLGNFASLDPTLKARGIKGASNVSKLDIQIWNEFYSSWDVLPFESEKLLANLENIDIENLYKIPETDVPYDGKVREQIIKARVNQAFFRTAVLSSYNNCCCITGIKQTELLIASHIKPWSIDESNRLNPRNGLAINSLHDKAFDSGLFTITPDYKIKISSILKKKNEESWVQEYFLKYEDRYIIPPLKFMPEPKFLEFHNTKIFKG